MRPFTPRPVLLKLLLSVTTSLLFLQTARANTQDTPLPLDDRVQMQTLPNGLKVFYRQNKKPEKRVNIRLAFKVGSLYEQEGDEGLAHFLEHMVFHGGKNFKPGEMDKWLKRIGAPLGGDSNAYTGWTGTTYFLRLKTEPKEVKEGLQFFEDLLNPGALPAAKINKERGVVLEEKRLRSGLGTRWWEEFARLALPGTRYPLRFPIGLEKSLKVMKRQQFVNFQKKYYRPELAAAVLVGDMPVKQMKALVAQTLARAPQRKDKPAVLPPSKAPVYPNPFDALFSDREVVKGSASLVWVQPYQHPVSVGQLRRQTAESVVLEILEDRLNERALAGGAPFAQPGVWASAYFKDLRLVSVGAESRETGQEKLVVRALTEEVDRLLTHGVLPEELEEQKAALTARHALEVKEAEKAGSDQIAAQIEDHATDGHPLLSEKQMQALWVQFANDLSPQELHEAFKTLMGGPNALTLIELPEEKKDLYKKGDYTQVFTTTLAQQATPKVAKELKKTVDYTALKPADILSRREVKEVGATEVKLSNGFTLYLKKTDFAQDTLLFNAWTDQTHLALPPTLWGLPAFMAAARTVGGTQEFTFSEFQRLAKGKNFALQFGPTGFGGRSTAGDFEEALQWLHDFLTRPGFREEALVTLREASAEAVLQARLDQETAFERAVGTLSCPGPGSWFNDDPAYFDQFTPQVLTAASAHAYPTQNAGLAVVGNVDVEKTIALLARYIGSLPATPAPTVNDGLRRCDLTPGQTRQTLYKGQEDRTMVRLVMNAPGYDQTWDVAAMGAASSALTLRLKERLREELGQVYYAFASCSVDLRWLGNGRCVVEFTVPFAQVEKAIAEARKTLAQAAQKGFTQKELDEVKLARKKNHEEQMKENWFWTDLVLEDATLRQTPVDWWLAHRQRIQALKLKQVNEAAARYLTPDTVAVVVATGEMHAPGKEKKARPKNR